MKDRNESRIQRLAGDLLIVVVAVAMVAIVAALTWRAVLWIIP